MLYNRNNGSHITFAGNYTLSFTHVHRLCCSCVVCSCFQVDSSRSQHGSQFYQPQSQPMLRVVNISYLLLPVGYLKQKCKMWGLYDTTTQSVHSPICCHIRIFYANWLNEPCRQKNTEKLANIFALWERRRLNMKYNTKADGKTQHTYEKCRIFYCIIYIEPVEHYTSIFSLCRPHKHVVFF